MPPRVSSQWRLLLRVRFLGCHKDMYLGHFPHALSGVGILSDVKLFGSHDLRAGIADMQVRVLFRDALLPTGQ